jgi:putative oxidoreductase
MRLFRPATSTQLDLGLTILRVIAGIVFAAHGGQKLFVFGVDGVAGGFAQLGIPLAGVAGPAVALVEFFGGLALVAGLLTRLAAAGLAVVMVGAIFIAHFAAGFFLPNGYEFPLTLLGIAITLVLTGAGSWSLDALIARRHAATGARASLRRAA